jgi:hypothetical protein
MKNYIILIAILFLTSCGNNSRLPDNEVLIAGTDRFMLRSSEVLVENINKEMVDEYNLLINRFNDIQIPITKAIKSNDYIIYIGIPVGVSEIDLSRYFAEHLGTSLIEYDNNSSESSHFLYTIESNFIYTCILSENNRKYVINMVGLDSILINNYYNERYLYGSIKFD